MRTLACRALDDPCPSLPVIPRTLPSPKRHVAGLSHHFYIADERVHLTRAPETILFRCLAVGDERVGLCGFHSLFVKPSAYLRLIGVPSTCHLVPLLLYDSPPDGRAHRTPTLAPKIWAGSITDGVQKFCSKSHELVKQNSPNARAE